MALCRVFTYPDGSVRVMHPNPALQSPGETDAAFVERICSADVLKEPTTDREGRPLPGPFLRDLPFADVDPASLPARTKPDAQGAARPCRHAWRLVAGRVIVDPTVPDPPHPQQALLDEIAAASTMPQLKAALEKMARGV